MSENKNTAVALKLNEAVGSVLNQTNLQGFERAYATAQSIEVLKTLLTPEYMAPIMQLQGNRLGFKTDKDKSGGYPMDVVKNCLIEAVLMGLQPYGNEMNIIAGNTYATKEGVGRLLATWKGLKYSLICGVPKPASDGKSAVIDVNIKWTVNKESKEETIPISVKMDAYTSVDAMVGKATRKGRAWLLSAISGIEIVEADVTDAEFLDVTPKQSVAEVSKSKEFDRVKAHINHKATTTFEVLAKCKGAITESDHELKELYVLKVIELATTEEELKSVMNWVDPEIDFDIYTKWDDKKRELTSKKK
jgi:hypothetical protein